MVRFFTLLFFSFAWVASGFEEPTRLKHPRSMSVSVIVPCAACHFPLLLNLLEAYSTQSRLPDEVSISLSNCQNIKRSEIDRLEAGPWPFRLKIMRHHGKRTAGENRNWAKMQATGDLLIAQDADDIPHPKRVEIVKYAFDHYDIDHLVHSWAPGTDLEPLSLSVIPVYKSTAREIFAGLQTEHGTIPLHNGNICLAAEFAKRVRWDHIHDGQEDVRFNQLCYEKTQKTALIPLGLILYRADYSYFRYYKDD